MDQKPVYKKVLIKISGEALSGPNHGIDFKSLSLIADEISKAHALKVQIGVVIGGGKYFSWR